jgi:hypothetical protein
MRWLRRYDGFCGQAVFFVLSLVFVQQFNLPLFQYIMEYPMWPVGVTIEFFKEVTQSYLGIAAGFFLGILIFGFLYGIIIGAVIRLILRLFKASKPVLMVGKQDIKATEITEEKEGNN